MEKSGFLEMKPKRKDEGNGPSPKLIQEIQQHLEAMLRIGSEGVVITNAEVKGRRKAQYTLVFRQNNIRYQIKRSGTPSTIDLILNPFKITKDNTDMPASFLKEIGRLIREAVEDVKKKKAEFFKIQ